MTITAPVRRTAPARTTVTKTVTKATVKAQKKAAAVDTPLDHSVIRTDFHVEPVIMITPALATRWLASNTRNRNTKEEAIGRYVADMLAGNWALNGEAMKFSVTRVLLDGQNRLRACIESGVTFPSMVVFGLPDKAQDTMDGGSIRLLADVLRIRFGVLNPNPVSVTVASTLAWSNGARSTVSGHRRASRAEHIAWFAEHEQDMIETTKAGLRIAASKVGLSPKESTILWWVLSKIDEEEATDFFAKLSSGVGLDEGHPILHLRNKLMSNAAATAGNKMPAFHKPALVLKAWNLYRDGEKVKVLSYQPGGKKNEKFPEPR